LGAAFSCSGGQCQAPTLRLTSRRPALGEPCVPADETFANFSGFSGFEVNIETRGSCGMTNVCLVNEFQGRVTCPSGQSGLPGDRPCATPDGAPVEVSVEPQLESRPAEQAVVCSCRCAGPTRGANYCSCPSGMRCEPLVPARDFDYEDLAGSYCVY
jgi:hypothetical protein